MTINEKPWRRAKEVCRALEYNKKTADIVKTFYNPENITQKYQMGSVTAAGKPAGWAKDSQKYHIYINEEGMYEVLFSSRQPKAKDLRRHCRNVLFPHVRQQLGDKLHAIEIEDLTGRFQALGFTNEEHQQEILRLNEDHQQAIEEKDNQVQVIQYENVALQAQRDVYQAELQRCKNTITHLRTRYVDHARDPGKDNIIIIVRKSITFDNDKYQDLPYYVARIQ